MVVLAMIVSFRIDYNYNNSFIHWLVDELLWILEFIEIIIDML